jgi:hypothetical protein
MFIEKFIIPYFSIDNARVIKQKKKKSKFVKNEHARYTLERYEVHVIYRKIRYIGLHATHHIHTTVR